MTRARLDAFTGTWTGTGEFLEGAGPGAGARLRTSHRYTWLTGEFFMLYQAPGVLVEPEHPVCGQAARAEVECSLGDDGARLSAFWENRADGQAWAPLCRTEEAR